jgi:hypothetical protein
MIGMADARLKQVLDASSQAAKLFMLHPLVY